MDMESPSPKKMVPLKEKPPFDCIALVLQGGGALGAYQAGVYEALAEVDLHPNWIAGISIGAINAAIIAGNDTKDRVAQLKGFWETVTANPMLDWATNYKYMTPQGDMARSWFNQMSAGFAIASGASGFFEPRSLSPFFAPEGSLDALSYYDTGKLKGTLEQFIDFDRINSCKDIRFSVAAVNVKTGNFAYFDNRTHKIVPEHVMASGALPPGFPPVEIDGEFYWDGGLITNTPLEWVVDGPERRDTLAFQVDLWPSRGDVPRNIGEVATRQKEIQYSSRTRAGTDRFKHVQRVRRALAELLKNLPPEQCQGEEAELLKQVANHRVYNIVQLIYRSRKYETHSRDYEFSRLTMNEHWLAGYGDAVETLAHPEIFERPTNREGVATYDMLKGEEWTEEGVKRGSDGG